MFEEKYKVYILLDSKSCITGVESTAFYDEQYLIDEGYIFIEEGSSSELHRHAQPNYLRMKYGKPTYDGTKFIPNFKYENGKIIELTDAEKEELYPPVPQQPTEQDKINAMLMKEIAKLKVGV